MFQTCSRFLLVLGCVALVAGCRPHGPEALRQGATALRAGRTAEAVTLLEQAVTDLPSDARAWNHLGLAYHAAGRDDEALKSHLRALERNRGFLDAWFNVGVLQFDRGNWLEAERALRTYLGPEANRTNSAAWRTLGLTQLESGQLDLAEHSLANATKLDPRDAEAWNGIGLTQVARRRHRDALKTFGYVAQVAPEFAPARLNAAVVTHQNLGDRRGALPLYRAYLALRPPNAAAVEALVSQLEQSLKPVVPTNAPPALVATNIPARLATNLVSRATNAPPKSATNAPAVVTKPAPTPTNPAPVVKVTPPPTHPPVKPAPPVVTRKPEPEPEVVRIENGPKLAVARDVKPPPVAPVTPPSTPIPTAITPVLETNIPPAVAATEGEASPLLSDSDADPERRGFWSKANPANWNWRKANPAGWFGRSDAATPTNRPTPLDVPTTAVRPSNRRTLALPTNAPVAVASAPKPKPVVPRYPRRAPAQFAAGDRVNAQLRFNEAVTRHSQRDYAGAATLYEQAAQADPTYQPAYHNLALVRLDQGDSPRAVAAAEVGAALQPDLLPARQLFATALQRADFPADAAEQWERVTRAAPNDADAHLALAGLYAGALAEPAQARVHYLRVLELEPNHPQAPAIRIWLAGNP